MSGIHHTGLDALVEALHSYGCLVDVDVGAHWSQWRSHREGRCHPREILLRRNAGAQRTWTAVLRTPRDQADSA